MHVAIVTETYPPEVNGVALTVQSLQYGLQQGGHRTSLIRPVQAQEPRSESIDELRVRSSRIPRYAELRFGWPATRQLRERWGKDRPQAIYVATEGPLGWSALNAARALGIPVASGLHTRFDDYMHRYGVGWLAPTALAWMRRFHNRADCTLVPTEELAEFLRGRGFQSIHRLGRAVDCAQFDPARRDDGLRTEWGVQGDALAVVHVGRIAAEKNLDLVVAAFRAIQAEQPDARMVWVGDGPERVRLQAQNPDFVFCGIQRGNELGRHFASADLFLFPSQSETFGNVTLESLASGVPIVAYRYGAAREYVRDGETGCTPAFGDDAAFITTATELANAAERRHTMGERARTSMLESNPQAIADAFAELLVSLCTKETSQ